MVDYSIYGWIGGGLITISLFLTVIACLCDDNDSPREKRYQPPKDFEIDPDSNIPPSKQLVDAMFGSKEDILNSESLEKMATYADGVCVKMRLDKEFIQSQAQASLDRSNNPPDQRGYKNWNGTSFGNMAHLILYGHPDHRDDFRRIFQGYLDHTGTKLKFDL